MSACLLVGGALFGCGSTLEAKAPTAQSLHSEAEAILALRAPRYTGSGEKADAIRFIKSEIAAWIVRRKAATYDLIAKYETVRAHAPSGPNVAALYGDVAHLLYDLCREFIDAGVSSAGTALRANPTGYDAYLGALASAAVPELDRAITEAEKCVAAAQPSEATTLARCQAIRHDAALLRGRASPVVHGLDGATRL